MDEWEERINTVRQDLYADQYNRRREATTLTFARLITDLFSRPNHKCRPKDPHSNLPPCQGYPKVTEVFSAVCTSFLQCIYTNPVQNIDKHNFRVTCSAYRSNDGYVHYLRNTPSQNRPYNIQMLTDFLSHGYNGPAQYCTTIQTQKGRRLECCK
jgi:hypothetical protein